MTRGGRKKDRDGPERRCIATGRRGDKSDLIRFAIAPDGAVVPDVAERLPGRGIWVSADGAALDKAIGKGLFPRAAKQQVRVPPDLKDQVTRLLTARVIELVSLARKAGEALAGLEKVKTVLISGEAACLLQASDGSEREKRRLRPPDGEKAYFDVLSAQELGLAFGRDRVIHAALIAGGLARLVRYESARLAGLKGNRG